MVVMIEMMVSLLGVTSRGQGFFQKVGKALRPEKIGNLSMKNHRFQSDQRQHRPRNLHTSLSPPMLPPRSSSVFCLPTLDIHHTLRHRHVSTPLPTHKPHRPRHPYASACNRQMSTSADRTYEQQNDSALDALYSKVSSLRSVTIDIHNDSENQRAGLLSQTSDQFDQFGAQLQRTSNHFSRTIVNGARQHRLTLYVVGAFVGLWLLYKLFS